MDHWTESIYWFYIGLVFEFSSALLIPMIFFIELCYCKQRILDKSKSKKLRLVSILPYLVYISYSSMGWFAIVGEFNLINCRVSYPLATLCYASAKFFIYQCFYSKLYSIYSNSVYSFKLHYFIVISVFITIYVSITTYFVMLTHQYIQLENGCLSQISIFIYGIQIILDQFVSFLSLYLFIKPLKALIIISNTGQQTEIQTNKFKRTIIKYATLIFIAVFSSFIFILIIAVFGGTAFGHIDAVINCVCIALMHSSYRHREIYHKLCCAAAYLMEKYCYKWFVYDNAKSTKMLYTSQQGLELEEIEESKSSDLEEDDDFTQENKPIIHIVI